MKRTIRWMGPGAVVLAAGAVVAGDLNPPLVGMSPHTDETNSVSIELPTLWKDDGLQRGPFGGLLHWSGYFQPPPANSTGPDAHVQIAVKSAWSRLGLAFDDYAETLPGAMIEGSIRRGDGWVEFARNEKEKQKSLLFRLVELHGQVFELSSYFHEQMFPHVGDHVRALFDTFKVESAWPTFKAPAGFEMSTAPGATVWTDTKDKKTLKRILDAHAATFAAMPQWVPGEPAISGPPVVVVCDKDATFADLAEGATTDRTAACILDYQRRAFLARVGGKTDSRLEWRIHDHAATQYLQLHFGGKTNDWVDRGLSVWSCAAFDSKGKPERPIADYIKLAKDGASASKEDLAALLEAKVLGHAPPDRELLNGAFYAWHCFFRFGAGAKPYGERYAKYLDDLRKSGSLVEAKKAWDGVDQARLASEFRAWVAAWK